MRPVWIGAANAAVVIVAVLSSIVACTPLYDGWIATATSPGASACPAARSLAAGLGTLVLGLALHLPNATRVTFLR
jgi:hypothetical protein